MQPKPPIKKNDKSQIEIVYQSFKNNIDSLKEFIDTISPLTEEEDSANSKRTLEIVKQALIDAGIDIEKKIELKNDTEVKKKIKLSSEKASLLVKGLTKLKKVPAAKSDILYKSSFVLMVGYFEFLFADLLKFYHKSFPGNLSDKSIHVVINDLKEYDNVEDAIDYLISKEVEGMLFDMSFKELTEYFKTTLKINLEIDIIDWEFINETRERRHIIVHNNSIINKKYFAKSNIEGVPDKDKLKLNEKVKVRKEYFVKALNEIYLAGHIMIFNCWKQWLKDDTKNIISEVLDTTFDCLNNNLFDVSKRLSFYATRMTPSSDSEEDLLLRVKFNYFLSLKELENTIELEKALATLKTSTLSPIFKLAYYVLKNEEEKIVEHAKNALVIGDIPKSAFHDWPLFKSVRANPSLFKRIKSIIDVLPLSSIAEES
jgi:hypothetical protein